MGKCCPLVVVFYFGPSSPNPGAKFGFTIGEQKSKIDWAFGSYLDYRPWTALQWLQPHLTKGSLARSKETSPSAEADMAMPPPPFITVNPEPAPCVRKEAELIKLPERRSLFPHNFYGGRQGDSQLSFGSGKCFTPTKMEPL